jgi:hypothetical protein
MGNSNISDLAVATLFTNCKKLLKFFMDNGKNFTDNCMVASQKSLVDSKSENSAPVKKFL